MAKHKCIEGTWKIDDDTKVLFTHCQSCYNRVELKDGARLYEAYDWGREQALLEAAKLLKGRALYGDRYET